MVEGEEVLTFEHVTEEGVSVPYEKPVGDYVGVQGERVVEVGKVLIHKVGEGYVTEVDNGAHYTLMRNGDHTIAFAGPGSQRIAVLEGDQVIEVTEGDQRILLRDGDHDVEVHGSIHLKAHGAFGGGIIMDADGAVVVEARKMITFKVGQSELTLTEQGVKVVGPFIEQEALIKASTVASIVEIDAKLDASIRGHIMTNVVSPGVVKVAGSGVLIN
jgi:hypothetical protein